MKLFRIEIHDYSFLLSKITAALNVIAPGIPSNLFATFPNSSAILVTYWNATSSGECTILYDICLCRSELHCNSSDLDAKTSLGAQCKRNLQMSSAPVLFGNLEKFTSYDVFLRAIAIQSKSKASLPFERKTGAFSQPQKFTTSQDSM